MEWMDGMNEVAVVTAEQMTRNIARHSFSVYYAHELHEMLAIWRYIAEEEDIQNQ